MLAGVLVEEKDERVLKAEGVADSKQLTHPVRVKLAEIIKDTAKAFHVVAATPVQIDQSIQSGINLNTLEALKIAEIINKLNTRKEKIKVIIDCPSVNVRAWRATLMQYVHYTENLEVFCEHKADVNHPSVSAASILAKVAREEAVSKLKEEHGEIGSGYPSDQLTISFVKKHGARLKDSGIFRKTWATWKSLFPGKNAQRQATLFDFKAKKTT